uniref:Kelch like family member 7 n=1 Tax=Amphiprion ocellaris TaxID=80972 RepID=A0AAQ5ZJL0_AMPOC
MSSSKKMDNKSAIKGYRQLTGIMGVMNDLRKEVFLFQGELCDVALVVQGRRFPAHRVVLAAASHFFRVMFTTRMMESVSSEVELRSADPNTVELLIEYIYTAQIAVNSSNVESLLDAANQYQIEPVKKMCVEFLKGQIDATNCLGISSLADYMYCPELKAAAEDFVQLHFTEVYKLDEFLQLDVTQLTRILHQDKLTVRAEAQIYDAAVRWLKYDVCNRQQYMVEVLGCVRFPLLSKTFLSMIMQAEPLIQDNPQCLKMVLSGMCYHLLSPEDHRDLGANTRHRLKKLEYRIAVFGGSQPEFCHYFNPKDSSFRKIGGNFKKHNTATAVFWGNAVYFLGGSRTCSMECYNILKNNWCFKVGPPTPRNNLSACAASGKIYTSGGSETGGSALGLFECYDIRTELWQVQTSMLTARLCHGSVEANGLIYVCGGMVGNIVSGRILNNCEVYDPKTHQWRALCGMREARRNHGLVVVNNRIYAVGGLGTQGGLDSVEYYNIATNEWCAASPMPWRGVSVKCAAVGDVIYVLTGRGQFAERLPNVMKYHTETDRWVTCSKTPSFLHNNCLICVVGI